MLGTEALSGRQRPCTTPGLTSCRHLQERRDGLDLSWSGEGGSSARAQGESTSGGASGATQSGTSAGPATNHINLGARQLQTQLARLFLPQSLALMMSLVFLGTSCCRSRTTRWDSRTEGISCERSLMAQQVSCPVSLPTSASGESAKR